MNISITNPKREETKALAVPWLIRILGTPTLAGIDIPVGITGYIYMDDQPMAINRGVWEASSGHLYLARESRSIEPLTRLGILAAVANLTNAVEEPRVTELLTTKLVSVIQQSVVSVHRSLIRSVVTPTRLAINTATFQAATEINGAWHMASGAPVEVDASWIIMDF